jgi:hypothetical protein
MRIEIDLGRGELVIREARFGGGARLEAIHEAAAAAGELLDPNEHVPDSLVSARGAVSGRTGTIDLGFDLGALRSIDFTGDDQPDGEHPALRTLRDRAFLRGLMGAPTVEHARGAMYVLDWGWLYALGGGRVVLAFPGHRRPVPLPAPGGDDMPMRCCGCGHLMDLGYPGVLRAGIHRGAVPCEDCGAVSWVRAYSMTEFYAFSQRPWVCEAAMHPAEGVRRFKLVPPPRKDKSEGLQLEAFYLKACPEHLDRLLEMFPGSQILPADLDET